MNPFVRLAFYLPGKPGRLARKAFGTLVIDHELSKSSQGSQSSQNGHKQKRISADPTVSIITVTYNSEKTLRHTIESVLAQTYTKSNIGS